MQRTLECFKENEYTIGIGLSVFVIFLFVILYYLYKEYKFLHDYSLGISIIFSYLIFKIVDDTKFILSAQSPYQTQIEFTLYTSEWVDISAAA